MLLSLLACVLALYGPGKGLSDRERAALVALRVETVAERRRDRDPKAVVGFGGEALDDAEWSRVRAALVRGERKGPPKLALRSLDFRRIDRLGPGRYRVGVMPQTHPPGPSTYSTYVVALGPRRDRVVQTTTGRVMAQTTP